MTSGQNTLTHVCCIVFYKICRINIFRILPLKINQICQTWYVGAKCHPIFILYSGPQLGNLLQRSTSGDIKHVIYSLSFRFLSLLYISAGFFLALYFTASLFSSPFWTRCFTCPPDIHSKVLVLTFNYLILVKEALGVSRFQEGLLHHNLMNNTMGDYFGQAGR